MARWEPGARSRLTQAALELYADRGFEQTTASEIAERAGVTERTFFRHFADKREVLFDGSIALEAAIVAAIGAAPPTLAPIELVAVGLEGADAIFDGRHEFVTRRAAVIAANPSLQERELFKFARMGEAMADAIAKRGFAAPVPALAAEAGVAVFKTAFDAWIGGESDRSFADGIRPTLHALAELTGDALAST